MANRLTKIVTRTGDKGETGMADGSRIAKDDLLMHVQGDVDELNSLLGLLASKLTDSHLGIILDIQHDLFDVGGELSLGKPLIQQEKIDKLEQHVNSFNENLKPLKEFILPGGTENCSCISSTSYVHVGRFLRIVIVTRMSLSRAIQEQLPRNKSNSLFIIHFF